MRRRQLLGAAAGAAIAVPRVARAAWPSDRPIEIIVPSPPGGGMDMMARAAANAVQPRLPGARFVVVNRPGAAGQIAIEAMFAAAPDGYTLGAVPSPVFNTIAIERRVRYRVDEFTYIANVADDPGGFWVAAASPLRTLADLQAAARREPGALAVGTAGAGSDDHLLLIGFQNASGVELLHAPYNGTAPILQDLLGGRLAVGSLNMSEGLALMRQGVLRALAQGGPRRWAPVGEVPTFIEQGFAVEGGSARGIVAPPGLPPDVAGRLREAFAAALEDPVFLAEADRLNMPLRPLVGDNYRAFILANDATLRALWARQPWRE